MLANAKAPKNGYAYIYVSNENDEAVYFDNLQVVHNRGRIIEENHYYAFGLKIAGISSNKLGNDTYEGYLQNKNLYNDKELIDDADLDWYDYGFRNYDAQIGRFTQLDPLTWDYPELTNYQYAGNEPIANIDIDGLEPGSSITVGLIGDAATSGTYNVIARAAPRVTQTGISFGARLSTAIVANTAKITSAVVTKTTEQWEILKWNTSQRWDNFKQAASDKFDDIKAGIEQRAYDEGKSVWQETLEVTLGGSLDDPMTLFGRIGPIGRVKGLSTVLETERAAEHLYQVKKYGQAGFKELENGRIRYYGTIKPAKNSGSMQGARRVREWNSANGSKRTWYETLDKNGNIRQVHPKYDNLPHYTFDANGKYTGKW